MGRIIRRRLARRGESGVALVEFAMVLPLLVLVCLGSVDFGRAYAKWNAVKNAAREGAAFAQLHPGKVTNTGVCADPQNITWHVRHESDDGEQLWGRRPEFDSWHNGHRLQQRVGSQQREHGQGDGHLAI